MSEYALGQSDQALKRLIEQAEFLEQITDRMLRSAGLTRGMRVLDIGCGAGDTTFQAAGLVGPDGHVLGIDQAPEPIALARRRASDLGLHNASFRQGTENDLDAEPAFDAVIARYVLIYQPDGVAFLRRLAARLKPGGILAFQEVDFTHPIQAIPPLAHLDSTMAAIVAVMATSAADAGAASRMASIFAAAGLLTPSGFCERPIGMTGNEPFFRWLASSYAVLQPHIQPGAEPIDVDRLVKDLMRDVAKVNGCAHGPDQWCVWAKIGF